MGYSTHTCRLAKGHTFCCGLIYTHLMRFPCPLGDAPPLCGEVWSDSADDVWDGPAELLGSCGTLEI